MHHVYTFLCGCTYYLEYPSFYNITKLNCHLKHTFNTLPAYIFYYIDHFHQSATILQHCHTWPRIYHVNTTFTKLPPSCNGITHGHEFTTSIPLSPNCYHFTTSHMATILPRQFHFHQTATILQRYHARPRIYHVNSTFTKLPPHGHVTMPRHCHFHVTATFFQRGNHVAC